MLVQRGWWRGSELVLAVDVAGRGQSLGVLGCDESSIALVSAATALANEASGAFAHGLRRRTS